jgi:hypothetical protein
MKKLIITAIILIAAASAWSQDHFALGLKGGFTSTHYTTDNLTSPPSVDFSDIAADAKSGYLIGAYARLRLIGNLTFQPELYYAKKSGQTNYTTTAGDNYTQNINYYSWDIPLLVNFNLIDLKVVKLYALTGPSMSFITKNSTAVTGTNGSDDANKASWGYQLGGGVEVWRLSLDCRYEWGLSNVSTGYSGLNNVEFDRKGNMLTFALGFKLIGL